MDPALLAFLRDPSSYPHRPKVLREVHTHASLVFLVPPWVYKVKKPVNFGFLDFSTLEKRHRCCLREVELNSRLAPGVYRDVMPITRSPQGFAFGGPGPVVEHAVRMRWLDPSGFLDVRIAAGSAGRRELERVARTLAAFYQQTVSPRDVAAWGHPRKLRISTNENFAQTRRFIGHTLSPAAFDAIRRFTAGCYLHRADLFEKRMAGGWIRDCHGDLHLDHIHVTDRAVRIYDCIEFNDRLRHLDVASDSAFLSMDLDYHGRPDLARFFRVRLSELLSDPEMLDLMDFYQCYRAYVRGKVESLQAGSDTADDAERQAATAAAKRHFQLALRYAVAGPDPVAIVIAGRVASGKSTLAAAIASELGWPVLSSDQCRKTLTGVPRHIRGDAAARARLYAPAMTGITYQSLIREAAEHLQHGRGVILDATFSRRAFRDQLRATVGDGNLRWLIAEADAASTRNRLLQRGTLPTVVSDARIDDLEPLDAAFEEPEELPSATTHRIGTKGSAAASASLALRIMAQASARGTPHAEIPTHAIT
jgi:hypothetical protein